jgi:hypothetical protein
MVEALLVIAIGLGVLCFRRLGQLLRRDEASYAYLEARLEDRIRTGIQETAAEVQKGTAASLTTLGDSVLEQIAQDRLALEHGLEALAERVVEAGRASGETLDAAGRQAAEDARRTRQALAEALETLHGALGATLREMRELHEQAVRELRRPLRQAVAIQQEIRRARDQHEGQAHRTAGEGASALDATSRAIASRPPEAEVPGTPAVHPPRQEEPIQRPPQTAAPRPRRLAELLGRVQRRTLGSPARTDGRARP